MHNLFTEFGLFLWAVAQQYIALAAGCAVTVMIDLLAKHWLKRSLSYREDLAILGVFVFLACFLAWRAQYEATKPQPSQPIQVNIPPQAAPQIQVNVPPPVVNIPAQMAYMASSDLGIVASAYRIGGTIAVDATCKNISQSAVANNATCIRGLRVVDTKLNLLQQPIVTEAVQDSMYRQFREEIIHIQTERTTYGPNESKMGTVFSPTIDEQLDLAFRNGTKTVLYLGEYSWKDGTGEHTDEICAWLQMYPALFTGPGTMASNVPILWNNCVHHNGLVSH
jgi:hypothetical protein